jgi:hypothetical protein
MCLKAALPVSVRSDASALEKMAAFAEASRTERSGASSCQPKRR